MAKTSIEYADEVSNPLYARPVGDETVKIGTFCEKPDKDGTCKNCWAEVLNLRFGNKLAFDKQNREKIEWIFREREILRLVRLNAKKTMSEKFPGLPLVVFCCDTFDIFQPSISDDKRDDIFDIYDRLGNLILLIQTTYPVRMKHYFQKRYGANGLPSHYWIGMSAGTQWWLDNHIGALQQIKAAQKYVIFEPLLEEIKLDVEQILYDANVNKTPQFTFAIIGGESGAKARPCNIDWIRSIVRQCKTANVPVFVKQLGSGRSEYSGAAHVQPTGDGKTRQQGSFVYKHKKGGDISEFPADLRDRQFPTIYK